MTRIKMCGLKRPEDILQANMLMPEYIGFVFFRNSRRYVTKATASGLKALLDKRIKAVGVFVDEEIGSIADLAGDGIIDMIQLHGNEDNGYIAELRKYIGKPVINAFRIKNQEDIRYAIDSEADYILLDSGAGTGKVFDWNLLKEIKRPYFLAGGLDPFNVSDAIDMLRPFAVDVSSGIEKNGKKDPELMKRFVSSVRKDDIR